MDKLKAHDREAVEKAKKKDPHSILKGSESIRYVDVLFLTLVKSMYGLLNPYLKMQIKNNLKKAQDGNNRDDEAYI